VRDDAPGAHRLRDFIQEIAVLVSRTDDEAVILKLGGAALAELVSHDDWLPDAFALPTAGRYAQYLLHCDALERFSIVSFVWGPGQGTPVHNHTVWGLVGMLRGAEISQAYSRTRDGLLPKGPAHRLEPGDVEAVSPRTGDIHQVRNALIHQSSVSIHVYGGNIGVIERSRFDASGRPKRFVSGYANALLPNLWAKTPEPVRYDA
jgi:predicted metal-dependent enzyme (double-stranded beta helix superfamily)